MKRKRMKRLERLHREQPLTMWRDDIATLAFVHSGELDGSVVVVHNNYKMVFCVASNWEEL